MEQTKLDSLSQGFLTELERVVPRNGFRTEFTDKLIVTIPALDMEVGAITIWLDGEVTVGIGELHHCHFAPNTQAAPTPEEREQVAAKSAASYIRDILDDRIHFQVQFEAGRCRGSSSSHASCSQNLPQLSGVDEVREYVWSHRIRKQFMTFHQNKRNRAGYTLIEFLEMIAAIALGGWLAERLSRHFEGGLQKFVFWSVATIGSVFIFVLFLYRFGYLLSYLRRRTTRKQMHESDKVDAP